MKEQLYNYFVRKNGRVWYEYERYVREHAEEHKKHRLRHIILLFKLNWFYRVRKKNIPYLYWDVPVDPVSKKKSNSSRPVNAKDKAGIKAKIQNNTFKEKKGQPLSMLVDRKDVALLVEKLCMYDVISFDMFDTLIFRCVAEPTDVFPFVGVKLGIPNFKKIRVEIEEEIRSKNENNETCIEEIYSIISKRFGIDMNDGIALEFEYEKALCIRNPYMYAVYQEVVKRNKRIIVTSNMYWSKTKLEEILRNCGYTQLSNIYVSCEVGKNKKYGELQNYITNEIGKDKTYIHIGDNYFLDVEGSRCAGWIGEYYQSVRKLGNNITVEDMTSLSSSIYRGLINNKCFSFGNLNPYYEYGYVYAGYLVLGFCKWLEELAKCKRIDKFLFVSRDMHVVYNAYKLLGGKVEAEYIKASRTSTIHLSFNKHIDHFVDWHIRRRISSQNTIKEVLTELELNYLIFKLSEVNLDKDEILTQDNLDNVKQLLYSNKELILDKFSNERLAAKKYYEAVIGESKNVCIVDLGWKASTYSSLNSFLRDECNIDINIYGAMIGMEGHPFVEDLLCTKNIFTYVFSSEDNKDLMNLHNKNGNVWRRIYEIIFTSNEKSLLGFEMVDNKVHFKYMRKEMRNDNVVTELHHGVLDFINDYFSVEKKLHFDMHISGREAYMPLLNIMKNEEYNYKLFSDFEVCFIAGNVAETNAELFKDVVENGGK